jgi:hypothetical protein
VLGLIGLAIPISRSLAGNLSAAWYAVSLVPRTVVAGHGVRIWMRWPLVIAALLLLGILGVLRIVLPAGPPTTYLMVVVVAWLVIALISAKYIEDRVRIEVRNTLVGHLVGHIKAIPYWLVTAVPNSIGFACLLIGASMFFEPGPADPAIRPAIREAAPILFPSEGGPYVFRGILVFLISSFFFGMPFALWASLPLPRVKVTKQPEGKIEGAPHPLEGWLVAHSDGFWHLLVVAKKQKEQLHPYEQREFLSIPDANVLEVRMLAEEDTATSTTRNEDTKSEQEKAG